MKLTFKENFFILKCILTCFVCVAFLATLHAQNEKDTLQQYSHTELNERYKSNYFSDPAKALLYMQAILKRATAAKDYKLMSASLAKVSNLETNLGNYKNAHKYLDEAIIIAIQKLKNDSIKNGCYLLKGNIYYSTKDYENSLHYYTKAYQFQKQQKHTQQSLDLAHNIALIKSVIGDQKSALRIFKENYKVYVDQEKEDVKTLNKISYISTLIALSDTYITAGAYSKDEEEKRMFLDSAEFYNTIGFEKSALYKDYDGYNYFLVRNGIINYEHKAYKEAIKDLKASHEKAVALPQKTNIPTIYYYLGKSYQKSKEIDSAIVYLKKVDSVTKFSKDNFLYLQETYSALAHLFTQKGEVDNALKYYHAFVEIDNVNESKSLLVRKKIHEDFDIALLKSEIEDLANKKEDQENKFKSVSIFSGILLVLLVIVLILYKVKQKENKVAFEKLLAALSAQQEKKATVKNTNSLKIDDTKVQAILSELRKFEEKEMFLDLNCNLDFVAKKTKTNKAYLSKVIHKHKGTTFIKYITSLRINYAIERLKNDKLFRSYDIKSIAQELGFKSPDSFSRAFKRKTNIYPSYYIRNLDKIRDEVA